MADDPKRRSFIPTQVREHFALMTKSLVAVGGLGGIGGVVGAIQLVTGMDGQGPLVWLSAGLGLLVASQIWAVQRAIKERNAARRNASVVTQKFIEMGEGASLLGSSISNNVVMSTGTESSPMTRRPRRRWFPRVLEEAERQDLADRCDACSKGMLEWLHRPSPLSLGGQGDWHEQRLAEDAHRAETDREFHVRYVVPARDLLNECAEAGYSLDAKLESMRLNEGFGEIRWHDRSVLAEGLVA